MSKSIKLAALATVLAVSGALAFAATATEANDAIALKQAGISLTQAIAAAEAAHAGSKAVRAEFEHSRSNGWVYDVEVISANQVFDVKVDPKKGTVMASTLDKADRDDEHDRRD